MKKFISFVLFLLLIFTFVTACSSNEATTDSTSTNVEAEVLEGELFDAGNVTVIVPEGWKAFPMTDPFADEEGALDPNCMNVYKGAEEDYDMFSKAGMQINYYGADKTFVSAKDFYDDVTDLDPFTLGNYEWDGYTGISMGYPVTVVVGTSGDTTVQVVMFTEMDDNTIALEDSDVQAILKSITGK